jgi:hypothetical protein
VLSLLAEIVASGGSVAVDDGADPGTVSRPPWTLRMPSAADDAGADRGGLAERPPGILRAPEEPPPGGIVPRLQPRTAATLVVGEAAAGPADAAVERAIDPGGPVAGSGPLRRPDADASLRAELVVHGRAPAGTLLDLGGHAYQVGPGGRFVLRIPIREAGLVQRVLGALPQLPVVPRPDGDA